MTTELDKEIKNSEIIVHRGRFAYLKTTETEIGNHFLICRDQDEITVVTEEKNLESTKYSQDVKWFKLIEIKVATPFLAKGFLAKVSKTIADQDMNILIVSTFSKDYILLNEKDWQIGINALKEIGFQVEIKQ